MADRKSRSVTFKAIFNISVGAMKTAIEHLTSQEITVFQSLGNEEFLVELTSKNAAELLFEEGFDVDEINNTLNSKKYDHVTPLLIELHWLPVEYRIIFKILLITFKVLNGIAPNYLRDLLEPYVPRRTLRSMSKLRLVEQSFKLSTYGLRAFSVSAPRLWNGIPLEIRQSNSVSVFKKNLKTSLSRLSNLVYISVF